MLPSISILVGVTFLVTFSFMLGLMLTRPAQWARFTQKDHDFWIKRGLPVKFVGACRRIEQGRGFKVLVTLGILVAVVLIVTASVLPSLVHHH